ncbi:menaquinone biosynthesis protein [Candidatus Desantisbacteria bacterium]|nr:menaquinone biosynthesis protein [Candidatus Desantisbacteria bacterium]
MLTRLGYLDFINCLPVYFGILEGKIGINAQIIKGFPNQLNALLASGDLDISPISSIEYARHQDEYLLLPDICLNSEGPVKSVVLISKFPMEMLDNKSIALPTTSATSVVLLKILLSHLNITYEIKPPELSPMLNSSDAALLIGDDALRIGKINDLFLYDLAELWQEKTGFPIVFAVWAVRKDYITKFWAGTSPAPTGIIDDITYSLRKSLNYGLANIDKIIDRVLPEFPCVDLWDYFKNLKYEFGAREREGLLSYYDYAFKLGLCERITVHGLQFTVHG